MTQPASFNGADLLVTALKDAGVELIFAITGAGNLAIIDAIKRDGSIRIVFSHHEQAAVMEAQGYSRIKNKIGVALVTTGAGSTNVATGALSAYLDSIPVFIISGNESSFHCLNPHHLRAYGVQGFDSVAVMNPITKEALRIQNSDEILKCFYKLLNICLSDRRGPVLLDFPMDLQRATVDTPQNIQTGGSPKLNLKVNTRFESEITKLAFDLDASKRPLFYIGNGCRGEVAYLKTKELIDKLQAPYALSWSALDLFLDDDELNIGRIGIYGDRFANILLQKSDIIICLGTRLAIPQVGYDKLDFARNATKWVVEIDPTECAKFEGLGWNVLNMPVEEFLTNFLTKLNGQFEIEAWKKEISRLKMELPRASQIGPKPEKNTGFIHSVDVLAELNLVLDNDAIVATDVGAALLNGHYIFGKKGTQRFFTSQGLGEMGFGLPGAIGAHFAEPEKQIICLNTDGAIMFNLQELQLIKEHKIPLKLFIFNNDGYSMIKISQENLFDGRISGSSIDSGISFPSFVGIASLFGFEYTPISAEEDLVEMREQLTNNKAVLFEVKMLPSQKYLPRLSTSKLEDGALISPPIEDLDPLLDINELEKYLGYKPHLNSYRARGILNDSQ